jgi:hypothetical protein
MSTQRASHRLTCMMVVPLSAEACLGCVLDDMAKRTVGTTTLLLSPVGKPRLAPYIILKNHAFGTVTQEVKPAQLKPDHISTQHSALMLATTLYYTTYYYDMDMFLSTAISRRKCTAPLCNLGKLQVSLAKSGATLQCRCHLNIPHLQSLLRLVHLKL